MIEKMLTFDPANPQKFFDDLNIATIDMLKKTPFLTVETVNDVFATIERTRQQVMTTLQSAT